MHEHDECDTTFMVFVLNDMSVHVSKLLVGPHSPFLTERLDALVPWLVQVGTPFFGPVLGRALWVGEHPRRLRPTPRQHPRLRRCRAHGASD